MFLAVRSPEWAQGKVKERMDGWGAFSCHAAARSLWPPLNQMSGWRWLLSWHQRVGASLLGHWAEQGSCRRHRKVCIDRWASSSGGGVDQSWVVLH